jgi:subtilase family serine protease
MKRGSPLTISDTVTNKAGTSTAGASTTNFYLLTTSTFGSGATLLGSRAVPSLGAGASNSGSTKVTIPTTIAVGNYFLIAVADANSNVAESDETNNTTSIAIAIKN